MNMKAEKLDISGVLLFDKGLGDSSNQALQQVKRLFRAKKTGHTGTLDPLASGLLPLMFGQATKFADDLISANKRYVATLRLGFSSTTGDAEGIIDADTVFDGAALKKEDLQLAANRLTGDIEQVPPMFSALKKDGRALYELARQGIEIERQPRQVTIYRFDILEVFHQPEGCFVTVDVECSKGTYVRTLAEDFAAVLGTRAYLTALRRTAVGELNVADALTLDELKAYSESQGAFGMALIGLLKPVDALLKSLGKIDLPPELARRFTQGQRLPMPAQGLQAGRYRIYGQLADGKEFAFLGTGNLETQGEDALLRPTRLIQDSL